MATVSRVRQLTVKIPIKGTQIGIIQTITGIIPIQIAITIILTRIPILTGVLTRAEVVPLTEEEVLAVDVVPEAGAVEADVIDKIIIQLP